MSSDYPKPKNAAEKQAEKDKLASRLSGSDEAAQKRAQDDARRLEKKHGLEKKK